MRVASVAPPALTAFALVLVATAPAAAAPSSIEQARQASEQGYFDGVLDVQWRVGDQMRLERLTVNHEADVLLVQGGNQVMARSPFDRLLAHAGHGWEQLWRPGVGPGARPDGRAKYEVTDLADGPMVAGRPSRTVEIRQHGLLRERMYLDTATNLMLRRDQYDDGGAVVRSVAFEKIVVRQSLAYPVLPPAAPHSPQPVPPGELAPATAPDGLADGYQRVGVFRSASVLHVLYSDGIYDLSIFEQGGRLRRADLPPSGQRVSLGRSTGWRYAWPGGQLLVWSAKGRVLTAVSDAPADQIVQAARSLPDLPAHHLSLAEKLKRACQSVMEPLA